MRAHQRAKIRRHLNLALDPQLKNLIATPSGKM